MSAARKIAVLLLASLALGACGKKPRVVDPPQGKAADTFPQTYPDPALDPKPGQPVPGEVVPGWKFP